MIDQNKLINHLQNMKLFNKITASVKRLPERLGDTFNAIPQGLGVMTQADTEASKSDARAILAMKRLEAIEGINDLRSAELYLRGCGLSRTASKAFISRLKSLVQIHSELLRLSDSELYK